jgi:hypothetical protein
MLGDRKVGQVLHQRSGQISLIAQEVVDPPMRQKQIALPLGVVGVQLRESLRK